MSPKLTSVRSESWLDLTAAGRVNSTRIQTDLNGHQNYSQPASDNQYALSGHRHSIGDFSQQNSAETSANQHLLIRLRQQSYLRNRPKSPNSSSMVSSLRSSSDLSQSVELNPSLASLSSSTSTGAGQSMKASTRLLREPVALKSLRSRLERRSLARRRRRPTKQSHGESSDKGEESTNQSGQSSFGQRSWSSLSEQISGKLSHIGHSWKQLLYNYNKRTSNKASQPKEEEEEAGISVEASASECLESRLSPATRQPNNQDELRQMLSLKRRLTVDWVQQHDDWLLDMATSPPVVNDEPANRHSARCTKTTRPNSFHQFIESRIDTENVDGRATSGDIEANINLKIKPILSPNESTSSSATLVSEMILNNNNNNKNKRQEPPMDSTNKQQQVNNAARGHFLNVNTTPILPAHVATSDYWSATSKSDQSLGQQPTLANQFNLNNKNEPQLLLMPNTSVADADYYLDVAMNAASRLDSLSLSPNLDYRDDLIMSSPQVNLLGHQQQQQQLHNQQILFMQRAANQTMQLNSQLNEDYDDYAVPADETCCRLDRSQVELVQLIGEGQKGYVFLGKLQSKDGQHIVDVAIKTLKYETDQLIDRLMSEAAMMRQLEHPHIIKFIGVCPETPALIAMELAQFGEIKSFLKLNKHLIRLSQLVLYTFQISTALSYLESKHYVHRDVAARNVLVCSHTCVKLADFGLTRNLQPNLLISAAAATAAATNPIMMQQQQQQQQHHQLAQDMSQLIDPNDRSHYVAAPRVKLPVRWLAPESLVFRRFTSASDVWMFAVCSWELFHYGQARPWPQLRNNQVLMAIEGGQRLTRPANCPTRLYQLMLQCWSYAPVQRPKFREIKHCIWSIYLSERTKEQMELEKLEQQRHRFLHLQANLQQNQILMQQHQARQQQQQKLMNHQQQQQQQRPMSSSPLMGSPGMANYALSNCSSSSATTNHNDSTTDQSRGSSFNSLARLNKQKQQVAQQAASNNERLLSDQLSRFQWRPAKAHLLQKQRSQGTIGTGSRDQQMWADQHRRRGLDDGALVGRHRRQQVVAVESEEDDDDEDEDEDPDSESEPEQTQVIKRQPTARQQQQVAHRLGPAALMEPAYDGVFEQPPMGQVAMLRTKQGSSSSNNNNNNSGSQFDNQRPASGRKPTMEAGKQAPISKLHHREPDQLGQVLQALSITPMKAKLRGPPEKTVRVFSRRDVATPADEPVKMIDSSSSSSSPNRNKPDPQQEAAGEESHRNSQLLLHQRLLGRIRPASTAGAHRSSRPASGQFNYQHHQQQQHSTPQDSSNTVESVDQSLQLLESLMSTGDERAMFPKRQTGAPPAISTKRR